MTDKDKSGTPAWSDDKKDRNRFISENLELVIPVAKKFFQTGEFPDDLMQVGYIGLIKAADNFNPQKGVKFSTYATHCIEGEIRHYVRDKTTTIKIPRWLKSIEAEMSCFVDSFMQSNSRLPSLKDISEHVNISEDGIVELLKVRNIISLSELPDGRKDTINLNLIKSNQYENFKLPIEDRIVLEQAMEKLRDIERNIIYLFFYKDLTQTQIAGNLGLSQRKVSRMLAGALNKLKNFVFPGRQDVQ
jgi:RNA polymerase sigma-B factor